MWCFQTYPPWGAFSIMCGSGLFQWKRRLHVNTIKTELTKHFCVLRGTRLCVNRVSLIVTAWYCRGTVQSKRDQTWVVRTAQGMVGRRLSDLKFCRDCSRNIQADLTQCSAVLYCLYPFSDWRTLHSQATNIDTASYPEVWEEKPPGDQLLQSPQYSHTKTHAFTKRPYS